MGQLCITWATLSLSVILMRLMFWYRKAANQNSSNANRKFGDMYFFGLGCPVDQVKALHHYRLAAEQKDYVALHRLKDARGHII